MSQAFYIPDSRSGGIRYVDSSGIISAPTLDGSGDPEFNAHGRLNNPWGVTMSPDGAKLYIVDEGPEVVYAVNTATYVVNKVAGRGTVPGTLANNWLFRDIYGIACDSAGNLYITDALAKVIVAVNTQATSQTLFGVTIAAGDAAVIVGTGVRGFSGDGGPALLATIDDSFGIAIDTQGNLYFCDQLNFRIRKVDHTTHIITTIAGSGGVGTYTGDGGSPTAATLCSPLGVALDPAGNIYIADSGAEQSIHVINVQGTPQTLLGTVIAPNTIKTVTSGISNPLLWFCKLNTAGELGFASPTRVFPPGGNLWKVTTAGAVVSIAGTGTYGTPTGNGGPATSARIGEPFDMAFVPAPLTGTITVNKTTVPGGSPQSFTARPSWSAPIALTDGASIGSGPLAAGAYSITEDAVPGWLPHISVSNGDPASAINLAGGANLVVGITNTATASSPPGGDHFTPKPPLTAGPVQNIPLDNSPNQVWNVTVLVNNVPVTLSIVLRYNELAQYWVATVRDINGNVLLDSLPFVTGDGISQNLLGQFAYLGIGSATIFNASGQAA